ncbi:glucosaminidase domain-containing protein [Geminicoccus harenae]|uniref:glucosaminidase domain-containing protein n=1 Tax=Geminicoccus harenae TaxID=2498453 RepID=UPI00168AA09F|nr:glucosaminidase domain-containing protein [Geminicoccus harenae]
MKWAVYGAPFVLLSALTACSTVRNVAADAGLPVEESATAETASTAEAGWGCQQPQPGHPTQAEERTFVDEVGRLAQQAEREHGVPAAALTAMAIQESGYGWTRMAQETNNLLAWKYVPGPAVGDRKAWQIDCPEPGPHDRFVVFADRAEAIDFVAEQLATTPNYRADTQRYHRDRASQVDVRQAVDRWIDGIADPYSTDSEAYRMAIKRLMNNPYAPGNQLSPEDNLYRLSEDVSPARSQ